MPFVPSAGEVKRLRAAIDRASMSEAERIAWLFAFGALLTLEGILLARGVTLVGIIGVLGGFAVLYWRLRGGHLVTEDRELHGIGLRTEAQRAYTGLMVRHALTGANPLRRRNDHDPFATFSQKLERAQASEES